MLIYVGKILDCATGSQADANRKGSEHDVTCVYNEDTDKARIKK
jgi:hypothetical protein